MSLSKIMCHKMSISMEVSVTRCHLLLLNNHIQGFTSKNWINYLTQIHIFIFSRYLIYLISIMKSMGVSTVNVWNDWVVMQLIEPLHRSSSSDFNWIQFVTSLKIINYIINSLPPQINWIIQLISTGNGKKHILQQNR